MSKSDLEVILPIIARNPPIFPIIGGVILVLFGELVKIDPLASAGWSSLVTGFFLQLGWYLMIHAKSKYR
jgi:hypothetical protein